jgi:hypothetical protein
LKSALKVPGARSTALRQGVPKSCRAYRRRSPSVAILAIAAAFTVLAATILPTGIFGATKLPARTFTALKFPAVLTATKFSTWIFTAFKATTVLATTILTAWATIALMVWASRGTQG